MLVLRATKKLRDRIGGLPPVDGETSTTLLGDWYANFLPWRPQTAILVNARTLLPVLTPLAPAKGLPGRIAEVIAEALIDQNVPPEIIDAEIEQMKEVRVGPTVDRSVVGSMKDFIFLADHRRDGVPDLPQVSKELARVPCGPLFKRHVRPEAELAALIAAQR
ncbi:hypothetical protein FB381_2761 [Nocardioides albertanoniae]|uniref:DUF6933 domain-containing protein n=2 Tax=Nocardioides TaxID=1839 RepID=A0A543A8E7_9ACTN|nr:MULTISPECIES: hypothetical protein [Nocardioides]NYI77086.1 hypothetical protein [Nocardioides panzhihuensis]TQL68862.1 hypothetical protein FB381_2761 [Nocardioides albertanoniae]